MQDVAVCCLCLPGLTVSSSVSRFSMRLAAAWKSYSFPETVMAMMGIPASMAAYSCEHQRAGD